MSLSNTDMDHTNVAEQSEEVNTTNSGASKEQLNAAATAGTDLRRSGGSRAEVIACLLSHGLTEDEAEQRADTADAFLAITEDMTFEDSTDGAREQQAKLQGVMDKHLNVMKRIAGAASTKPTAPTKPTAVHEARFKPAVARSEVQWKLDGTSLSKSGQHVLDLEEVTEGSYWSVFSRKTGHGKALTLRTASGKKAQLQFGSLGPNDGMRQFVQMVAMISVVLATVNPKAKIHMGGGGGNTWSMFLGGLTLCLPGVFAFALAPGASESLGTVMLYILGTGMVGFGLWLAWAFRPWDQDRMKITADLFAGGIVERQIQL